MADVLPPKEKDMTENLALWKTFDKPPRTALKEIKGGRMAGKTDINPQWRYKAMTETFGPCGIGWKVVFDRKWTEKGENGEIMAFVDVSIFVRHQGEWSEPIPGTGGSTLVVHEKSGFFNDDDAFKKATTDALSTAMKMLGVGSEIYAGAWDGTKFRDEGENKSSAVDENKIVTAQLVVSAGWVQEIPHANQLITLLDIGKMTMKNATHIYNIYRPWRVDKKLTPADAAAKAKLGEIYQSPKLDDSPQTGGNKG